MYMFYFFIYLFLIYFLIYFIIFLEQIYSVDIVDESLTLLDTLQ